MARALLCFRHMSELDRDGRTPRKNVLKHLILQLHGGVAPDAVQRQLVRLLGQVPYGLVVEVEQELIAEGLPARGRDAPVSSPLGGAAGAIDLSGARTPPPGHPARVFSEENAALATQVHALEHACDALATVASEGAAGVHLLQARVRVNALTDVEKHYLRKEHLLFPFLERHGITGPPQVMWGKHDETRALLRAAHAALSSAGTDPAAARAIADGALRPVARAIRDMAEKEENILLPMSLDVLDEREWWEIARQSDEVGYCLVEPEARWRPASAGPDDAPAAGARVRLPTGSLAPEELTAILGALPLDATFVDAEDRVRWFSHGKDRVFSRNRAVLGRKVQFCHPPSSVGTVEKNSSLPSARARRRAPRSGSSCAVASSTSSTAPCGTRPARTSDASRSPRTSPRSARSPGSSGSSRGSRLRRPPPPRRSRRAPRTRAPPVRRRQRRARRTRRRRGPPGSTERAW